MQLIAFTRVVVDIYEMRLSHNAIAVGEALAPVDGVV